MSSLSIHKEVEGLVKKIGKKTAIGLESAYKISVLNLHVHIREDIPSDAERRISLVHESGNPVNIYYANPDVYDPEFLKTLGVSEEVFSDERLKALLRLLKALFKEKKRKKGIAKEII